MQTASMRRTYRENLELFSVDGARLAENEGNASVVGVRARGVPGSEREVVRDVEDSRAKEVALRAGG